MRTEILQQIIDKQDTIISLLDKSIKEKDEYIYIQEKLILELQKLVANQPNVDKMVKDCLNKLVRRDDGSCFIL